MRERDWLGTEVNFRGKEHIFAGTSEPFRQQLVNASGYARPVEKGDALIDSAADQLVRLAVFHRQPDQSSED